jgi:hypothetical protein
VAIAAKRRHFLPLQCEKCTAPPAIIAGWRRGYGIYAWSGYCNSLA